MIHFVVWIGKYHIFIPFLLKLIFTASFSCFWYTLVSDFRTLASYIHHYVFLWVKFDNFSFQSIIKGIGNTIKLSSIFIVDGHQSDYTNALAYETFFLWPFNNLGMKIRLSYFDRKFIKSFFEGYYHRHSFSE